MGGISGPRRRAQARPRAEIAVVRVLEKRLGALPVIADFNRRVRIASAIDDRCPIREIADLTHGEVIEVLVANRLTSPAPLWRVSAWAEQMVVEESFGIPAALLNDDRIARALDAIAPPLDEIVGSPGTGGPS